MKEDPTNDSAFVITRGFLLHRGTTYHQKANYNLLKAHSIACNA
jgi:hypothetical protein